MSICAIRFRVGDPDAKVVLQVLEQGDESDGYYSGRRTASWRDAKVEDLMMVAAYVRAHDALDSNIQSLQNTVQMLQQQVGDVLDRENREMLDRAQLKRA